MAEIIFQLLGSDTYWPGDRPGQEGEGEGEHKEGLQLWPRGAHWEQEGMEGGIDLSLHSRLHSSSTCARVK